MKVNYVLLISLLIVGALFVPAVSADYLHEYEETVSRHEWAKYDTGGAVGVNVKGNREYLNTNKIQDFKGLTDLTVVFELNYIHFHVPKDGSSGQTDFVAKIGEDIIATGTVGYNCNMMPNGVWKNTVYYFEFDNFDPKSYTGFKTLNLEWNGTIVPKPYSDTSLGYQSTLVSYSEGFTDSYIRLSTVTHDGVFVGGKMTQMFSIGSYWHNRLQISGDNNNYQVYLTRYNNPSHLTITDKATNVILHASGGSGDVSQIIHTNLFVANITSPKTIYTVTYPLESTGDPGDPGETPTMRTGTVTMTDNNGTSISGFEVTAVNHYTGQEYNVSTDTDVAVITLPMDRTIEIRNPQTGVYEEAPIGYYRFYGQAPGYKMLNEDGIKVSVMPEKYGSYQLCDIGVTSESGYLTGQHKFQIRSRSDNSILQTGTVSAKSATTGEWYNTTVSGGIATLVLPYDTSNTQSQYAGNYYVYATSPGYEDSDYGTQIVVMPHTVSEIRYILLTPIGGVPTAGNVTLRIQAFSETGPGVVNAEIFIAGVLGAGSDVWNTYIASSTGYLAVSVPGNSTYDIVASGAGYYDSARRVEVFTDDPPLIEIKLYLSGPPTLEPTPQPTGWPTDHPTTQPTGGIPDDDDGSGGFLMQAVRGIGLAFGVGFATAKLIFGMLLALSIGYATAKQLRGGAAEFGLGLLGGTLLGVLIGLLPVWIIVVLLLVVGLYIGNRYVGGGANNG